MPRILVVASGSISVLSAPTYISALSAVFDSSTRAIVTPAAAHILPRETVAHFCDGAYSDEVPGPGHVNLARWADVVLVLPATADLVGCAANGIAPNLACSTLLAVTCPVVVFPVMNAQMWSKPAVQRNLSLLEGDGVRVVTPTSQLAYEVASRSLQHNPTLAPLSVVTEIVAQVTGWEPRSTAR